MLGGEVLQPLRALGVLGVLGGNWGALGAARATGKLLGALGATGSHWKPQGGWAIGGRWGAIGGLWGPLGPLGTAIPAGGRWGPLGAAGGRWGPLGSTGWLLGAAKGHRWAGQIHLPPSLMDRKFQIFCKNEEEPYYLISINKQKLVVHYDIMDLLRRCR